MKSILQIDHYVTFWFQRWPAGLHPFMLALTQLGGVAGVVGGSVALAVWAYTKHKLRLAIAFAAVLPAELFNGGLKLIFKRVRPDTPYAHNMIIHTNSFPSGHAFGSMVFYGLLAYLAFTRLPHGWNIFAVIGLTLLIILIGISRVYLGAHYSLDVLGGWFVGSLVLLLIIKLTKI